MQYAIILTPALDGRNSPYGFAAPKPKPPVKARGEKSKPDEIEMFSILFTPGLNFIEATEWDILNTHPQTKAEIERCLRRGIIQVKKPEITEGGAATQTTADFAQLDDVRDVIDNCNDVEWLRRSIAKDGRPQVDIWCSERITVIEAAKKK